MKFSYAIICVFALIHAAAGETREGRDPGTSTQLSKPTSGQSAVKDPALARSAEGVQDGNTQEPAQLGEITVSGEILSPYRTPVTASATLIDAPQQELPTVVNSIPASLMELKNVATIEEALSLESGIFNGGSSFGTRTPGQYTIRGMSGSEVFIDGLPVAGGMGFAFDASMLERVDIVKGPVGSVSGGQTGTLGAYGAGGSVNMVLKSAKLGQQFGEAYTSYRFGDGDRERGQFDWNTTNDGGTMAFRIAGAAFRDRPFWMTSGADPGTGIAVAPAFVWQPGRDTVVTVQTNFQYQDKPGYMGIPVLGGQIIGDWDAWYGGPDSRNIYSGSYANAKIEHRLGEVWTIEGGAGLTYTDLDYEQWAIASNPGNFATIPVTGMSSWEYANFKTKRTNVFGYARGVAKFDTGAVQHQFLVGGDTTFRHTNSLNGSGKISGKVNVWDPTPPPHPKLTWSRSTQDLNRYGMMVQDYMSWGSWRFLVGSRFDQHISNLDNEAFSVSPRVGVSRYFGKHWVGFANAALTESPNFGYLTAPGKELSDSWRAVQYEGGVRYNPVRDVWLSASVFCIEQDGTPLANPDNPLYYTSEGKSRSYGGELSVTGSVTPWWHVSGSMTLLRYKDLSTGESFDRFPPFSASLWNTFLLPSWQDEPVKLSVGYRFNDTYMATFRGAKINDNYTIPSWQTVDVVAEFPLPKCKFYSDGYFRLALTNVFNAHYVQSNRHATQCFMGDPRLVETSLRFTF